MRVSKKHSERTVSSEWLLVATESSRAMTLSRQSVTDYPDHSPWFSVMSLIFFTMNLFVVIFVLISFVSFCSVFTPNRKRMFQYFSARKYVPNYVGGL